MRLVISWLRDFVNVTASPEEIADKIGLRGFEVASVEDDVIDFEVTANRPDCLSVVGLAREVATAFQIPFAPTKATMGASVPAGSNDRLKVSIDDAGLGPRYVGAVADITPAASPSWMTSRLQAAGVRPISAIVDITNYVLLELGHPMHAFDLDSLAGAAVRVRREKGRSHQDARRRRPQARRRDARDRRPRSRAGRRRRHGRRRFGSLEFDEVD